MRIRLGRDRDKVNDSVRLSEERFAGLVVLLNVNFC